jgi:DNA-binding response OmpR family regulator
VPDPERRVKVLVYSDNPRTREKVRSALGKRVHPDLPELTYLDVATGAMVVKILDEGGIDLAILDGEATPVGGMGLARQLKDELTAPPPILVLTGRPDDAWLATWSRAEAAVSHPIDPIRLGEAVSALVRAAVQ